MKSHGMELDQQLKNISWNELESYFGSRVFKRGERYFKNGRVSHWSNEVHLADFSRVEMNLQHLLDHKNYETVLDLTKVLLERACFYIESCNDDGDSAVQISECLNIGFKALRKCSWSNFDQLLFLINAQLEDDYELCRGASDVIDTIDDGETWSSIADYFYEALKKLPHPEIKDDYSKRYHRDRVSTVLVRALKKAGRPDEVLPVYENEAKITDSWEHLVYYLIEQKQYNQARIAAEEGIKNIGDTWPGTIASLRNSISVIAAEQGDYSCILLLKQQDFLLHPDFSSFNSLLETAIQTKNKDEMREWALHFLETGNAPAKGALKEAYKTEKNGHREFPRYETLISIAEKEKRVDDVWTLYQEATHKKSHHHLHAQVARIIKDQYPDESIRIWKLLAEQHIAQANPSSYVTGVGYLKEAQKICIKIKRTKEWSIYIEQLREANKRKPRFIKELRRLADEKLL